VIDVMKVIILLFVVIGTNVLSMPQKQLEKYEYIRGNGDKIIISSVLKNSEIFTSIIDGDFGYSAKISKSSAYIFKMTSELVTVAIPVDIAIGKSWKYKKINYSVDKEILMKSYDDQTVYIIKSQVMDTRDINWILYSRQKGIISFSQNVVEDAYSILAKKNVDVVIQQTYWLGSKRGLGYQKE